MSGALYACVGKHHSLKLRFEPAKCTRLQILIANNGMAAAKCIMSMRKWAFLTLGDEKLLHFVAMVRDSMDKHHAARSLDFEACPASVRRSPSVRTHLDRPARAFMLFETSRGLSLPPC